MGLPNAPDLEEWGPDALGARVDYASLASKKFEKKVANLRKKLDTQQALLNADIWTRERAERYSSCLANTDKKVPQKLTYIVAFQLLACAHKYGIPQLTGTSLSLSLSLSLSFQANIPSIP